MATKKEAVVETFVCLTPIKQADGVVKRGEEVEFTRGEAAELLACGAIEPLRKAEK